MATISLVTIGSELLKGRIVNTNASQIGHMLRQSGYSLERTVVIPDTRNAIRDTILYEMERHDIVLTSGGLGPTQDDITKQVLAELFDSEPVLHEPTLEHVKNIFEKRGRQVTPRNLQQAYVPSACEAIFNPKGTAPGMLFRKAGKMLLCMPGVPFEMLYMLEHEGLPRIKADFPLGYYAHKILRINFIPESDAADRIAAIEETLPRQVDIAYLPRIDGIWLELSVSRNYEAEKQAAQADLEIASNALFELFKDKFYTWGEDKLEVILSRSLTESGLSLAIAESMTGGQIAATLVSVSGASAFFKGSVTAYAVEIKTSLLNVPMQAIEDNGVVSEQVALAMAEGVRKLFQADIGLATTGRAEKEGEILPEVWIGYSDTQGIASRHISLFNDRSVNISRATQFALLLCLQQLNSAKITLTN